MIRRDYIIRMIEDFMAVLSRLKSLKSGQLWKEAGLELDHSFQKLVGDGVDAILRLSETELLARVIAGEPTMAVREKTLIVASLLKEAGDVAAGEGREEQSRTAYLKGLHLLLQTLATGEPGEWPEFVPRVDAFVNALDAALPFPTRVVLMQHYERSGDYAKAENMLFSMVEAEPEYEALPEFGEQFYRRLQQLSDATLAGGNLPRRELESGLAEWRRLVGAKAQ